ncbi:MAG: efflux RND transporter periplasmic adaptor subunit [Polyangiaceae bacterium]|nr:efflux RND transporter periplasmic adaptor subunit [Polyangiaceae bacterium]
MDDLASQRPSMTTVQNLKLGPGRRWMRWVPWLVLLALVALAAAGFWWWRERQKEAAKPQYETAVVGKGNIMVTVAVTGKIESVDSVQVGAEVSGKVDDVLVDFNDVVTKGQELARINTEQLDARVKEVRAQSAVSAASLLNAQATAAEAAANVRRIRALAERGLVSQRELETATAAAARAEASVAQSRAQQLVNAASLESAMAARDKAIIRSPIDGIVLSRSVEPGQTVAASLQAPTLFIVAKDLTTMVVKVEVDEADVGKVEKDQRATFTVDAHEGRRFDATVKSLKNVPSGGKDVVTYEAELTVNNEERLLRPGMTATATIITSERRDVLLVPNTALRFTPPAVIASAAARQQSPGAGGLPGFGAPRMMGPGGGGGRARPAGSAGGGRQRGATQMGTLWFIEGAEPKSVRVQIGVTDGSHTELLSSEIAEGSSVLIDVLVGAK